MWCDNFTIIGSIKTMSIRIQDQKGFFITSIFFIKKFILPPSVILYFEIETVFSFFFPSLYLEDHFFTSKIKPLYLLTLELGFFNNNNNNKTLELDI